MREILGNPIGQSHQRLDKPVILLGRNIWEATNGPNKRRGTKLLISKSVLPLMEKLAKSALVPTTHHHPPHFNPPPWKR